MTDISTTQKTRTITLTGRPPVRIDEAAWPVIAHGSWSDHDGKVESQANRTWQLDIRVRQHADGRAIVYGVYQYGTHWQHESDESHRVGQLLSQGGDRPAAINAVGAQLIERIDDEAVHRRVRDVADECIGDLPAEALI